MSQRWESRTSSIQSISSSMMARRSRRERRLLFSCFDARSHE
jgi:hypothetical protein